VKQTFNSFATSFAMIFETHRNKFFLQTI